MGQRSKKKSHSSKRRPLCSKRRRTLRILGPCSATIYNDNIIVFGEEHTSIDSASLSRYDVNIIEFLQWMDRKHDEFEIWAEMRLYTGEWTVDTDEYVESGLGKVRNAREFYVRVSNARGSSTMNALRMVLTPCVQRRHDDRFDNRCELRNATIHTLDVRTTWYDDGRWQSDERVLKALSIRDLDFDDFHTFFSGLCTMPEDEIYDAVERHAKYRKLLVAIYRTAKCLKRTRDKVLQRSILGWMRERITEERWSQNRFAAGRTFFVLVTLFDVYTICRIQRMSKESVPVVVYVGDAHRVELDDFFVRVCSMRRTAVARRLEKKVIRMDKKYLKTFIRC